MAYLSLSQKQFGIACSLSLLAIVAGCQTAPKQAADTAPSAQTATEFDAAPIAANAFAANPASGAACPISLAGGPPPKPAKGADFAKNAVGKNLVRNVGRNVLGNAIGGGAIGATIASQVVRTEQDLGGKWMATDGSNNCACEIQIRTGAGVISTGFGRSSGYKLRDAKGGNMNNISCSNPLLASVGSFALGYSFTGYDATLAIESKEGQAVGSLKRDGINYFSGTLADGTPVTLWRRGG